MSGLTPADRTSLGSVGTPLGYRQPMGMDLAASSTWRFAHAGTDHDVEAAALAIGAKLAGNLPLRSFVKRVGWEDVTETPEPRTMVFDDWVYVYGYTASVVGIDLGEQPDQVISLQASYRPRDFCMVSQSTTSNEIGIITTQDTPQQQFAPMSDVYGQGGEVGYILPQAFPRFTAINFAVRARSNLGIVRIRSVSIGVLYLRLPVV